MDIRVTLYNLLDAIHSNDRTEVNKLLGIISEWNREGGFLPLLEKVESYDGMFQVRRNQGK